MTLRAGKIYLVADEGLIPTAETLKGKLADGH